MFNEAAGESIGPAGNLSTQTWKYDNKWLGMFCFYRGWNAIPDQRSITVEILLWKKFSFKAY